MEAIQSPAQVVEEFVRLAMHLSGDVIVAVDPGANGAIAMACGRHYTVIDIPTITLEVKRTKKTTKKDKAVMKAAGKRIAKTKTVDGTTAKFNHAAIVSLFTQLHPLDGRIRIVLEQVPTTTGPGRHHADVLLNRAYAMWPLFFTQKGYPVEEVAPTKWKGELGLHGKDKEHSRLMALSLYPKADILQKQDHDRAEALLLIHYITRKAP